MTARILQRTAVVLSLLAIALPGGASAEDTPPTVDSLFAAVQAGDAGAAADWAKAREHADVGKVLKDAGGRSAVLSAEALDDLVEWKSDLEACKKAWGTDAKMVGHCLRNRGRSAR